MPLLLACMGPLALYFKRCHAAGASALDIVNLELLDQAPEFRGSLHQLLRGFLGVGCARATCSPPLRPHPQCCW